VTPTGTLIEGRSVNVTVSAASVLVMIAVVVLASSSRGDTASLAGAAGREGSPFRSRIAEKRRFISSAPLQEAGLLMEHCRWRAAAVGGDRDGQRDVPRPRRHSSSIRGPPLARVAEADQDPRHRPMTGWQDATGVGVE